MHGIFYFVDHYDMKHGILYFGDQNGRSNGSLPLKIENLTTKGWTNVVAIVKIKNFEFYKITYMGR